MKDKTLKEQEFTPEQEKDIKEIDTDQGKLQEYFKNTVVPELFKQDIRLDVVEIYAPKILEALISIQKGKTKEWEEYLKEKRETEAKIYSKKINNLEYVE